jgi:uncharacterized protein YggE
MRGIRLLLPLLALFAVTGTVSVRAARAADQPAGIQVTGTGIVTAKPDVATLTIGASVRADTAGDAFNRAEARIAALNDFLKAAGIPDSDIQTRQFSLNAEYGRSNDTSPPPVTGWRATHLVSVKLRDFNAIGGVVDGAVKALGPDATIQGINFAIENTDALAAQARTQAIANARAKAEAMAAGTGVSLGKLIFLQEVSAPTPAPQRDVAVAAPAPAASFAAQISPGELTITVVVEAVWAIA